MSILPEDFLDTYLDITNSSNIDEIMSRCYILIEATRKLLRENNIVIIDSILEESKKIIIKRNITSDKLTGTYEEIYSNWKNKMYHATKTNNRYLSFMTMASCQEFYDEMSNNYNIPVIDLIGMYNPEDLKQNAKIFDESMDKWKELYDSFNKPIVHFNNLNELAMYYKK